jgi:hypothetical protein
VVLSDEVVAQRVVHLGATDQFYKDARVRESELLGLGRHIGHRWPWRLLDDVNGKCGGSLLVGRIEECPRSARTNFSGLPGH